MRTRQPFVNPAPGTARRRSATVLALLLVVLVSAAACGDDGGSGEAAEAPDEGAGAGAGADTSGGDAPTSLFTDSDFASACRGIGIPDAAAYTPGDGQDLVVALMGEDPEYQGRSTMLPEQWVAPYESIADTELVVCLDRVSATSVEICTGYEDEGLEWEVEVFDASYEVTLREANTATEVASTTFDAASDGCPMFSFYSEGDPSPAPDYATPDAALEAWLVDYVG